MYRIRKEEYKGYDIVMENNAYYHAKNYAIFKDGQKFSSICLATIQAAKNVIDTHERALVEKNKYEQA